MFAGCHVTDEKPFDGLKRFMSAMSLNQYRLVEKYYSA